MDSVSSETATAWRERIDKQLASGQGIRDWCRSNGFHEHSFYWWRSRLGLSPKPARVRRRRSPGVFTEVLVEEPARQAVELVEAPAAGDVEPIRLRLLGGRELVVPVSMSDQRLAALIGLIEGRP
jgi:hypothetical protein